MNIGEWLSQRGWMVGIMALIAWMVLLWFMFGDVL
jgi:hypothetical protein